MTNMHPVAQGSLGQRFLTPDTTDCVARLLARAYRVLHGVPIRDCVVIINIRDCVCCECIREYVYAWEQIYRPGTVTLLSCEIADLEQSWDYFQRPGLHKLSA
ncbi:MAG: hypothetical protein WAN86_00520, partial [Hyphomicrobiaceae bacterium]